MENNVGTGIRGILPAAANPREILIPILNPVYEPGPEEIAMPSS